MTHSRAPLFLLHTDTHTKTHFFEVLMCATQVSFLCESLQSGAKEQLEELSELSLPVRQGFFFACV
jgi:hypothetical protein